MPVAIVTPAERKEKNTLHGCVGRGSVDVTSAASWEPTSFWCEVPSILTLLLTTLSVFYNCIYEEA
jgi:hypothetical protein